MLGIKSPLLSRVPGVSHRFFSAVGGTSPSPWRGLNTSYDVGDAPARVDENLARVRFQLGVRKRHLVTARQVHGVDVVTVEEPMEQESETAADGLFTTVAELAVGIRTADCAPILLSSLDGTVVAAVHAGWRGAVAGVLEKSIDVMTTSGVKENDIVAAIGPCIGVRHFEVGPEVIDAARARTKIDGLVVAGVGDRSFFDLAGFCAKLLREQGVHDVDVIDACTFAQSEEYFSYRRSSGKCGRMMSAIARTEPPPE